MAHEVLVPPLGTTVDTVTLMKWYKDEGDTVVKGEPLFDIETDKAILDVEAPASGVLRRITARAGDAVKALSPIALIAEPDEDLDVLTPAPITQQVPAEQPPAQVIPQSSKSAREGRGRIFISPRAYRLAQEHQVPVEELHATGPEGAIIERDVRAFLEAGQAQPAPTTAPTPTHLPEPTLPTAESGEEPQPTTVPHPAALNVAGESIPLRSVRAVIATRMLESATTTARVTLTAEADATNLVALRRRLVEDGVDVTYNDLFLAILGRALTQYPAMNASLQGDRIEVWNRIHVGLAVDTDRGLLVPVVRDVDKKGLQQLAQETQRLIELARMGRSQPEDLTGGTFTLTNLGMYGIDSFTPIINLPECGVLGVGRIRRQPVMAADSDRVVGRDMVWLSLTFDHRVIDGAPAARFLQRVTQLAERPHLLMA